jgi:predicted CoA-binding protein
MKSWAVVGATNDPAKFGHRIWHVLRNRGYRVYAVNPNLEEIEGEKCYKSLLDLPETPQVVDMVVNPRTGARVMKEIAQLQIKYVWMQPGTRSDEIREFAEENAIELIEDCVLVRVDG